MSSIIAEKIRQLTGAATRIVWCQQQMGMEDYTAHTPDFKLMGIDTDDGREERAILDKVGSYAAPLFTPKGDRIIFSDVVERVVKIVNWDGTDLKVIGPGFAVSVWKHPKTKVEWVFIRPSKHKTWFSKSRPLVRCPVDQPSKKQVMWSKSPVSWNWFSLSRDGKRAACVVPWPKCGMTVLSSKKFSQFDKGCWTAISPDNTYRMWVFDFDHRHVKLYDKKGKRIARIDVHSAPGVNDWEIYHPRWSNHVRFMTMTGPYSKNSPDVCRNEDRGNWIPKGGNNVDLYLGRFNTRTTAIEDWARVTENTKADYHGDAWIAKGGTYD